MMILQGRGRPMRLAPSIALCVMVICSVFTHPVSPDPTLGGRRASGTKASPPRPEGRNGRRDRGACASVHNLNFPENSAE
jgi:hypothetical protein